MRSKLAIYSGSRWLLFMLFFLVTIALIVARNIHYLLFHTLAELDAITVSFSLFTLAWVCRRYIQNGYLIILGSAYGAIGLVDVFHTLTFKGLNIIPQMTLNHPTQFWLTARLLEAVALVIAPLCVNRRPGFEKSTVVFIGVALLGCTAVLSGYLPDTFIEGVGLTAFKIYAEYLIICLLVLGLILLFRKRKAFSKSVFVMLHASIGFAIATEICFVHYIHFYDFVNELGHYFRFISVLFAYFALVVTGVQQPTEMLYRELAEKERALSELAFNDQLTRLPNRRLLMDRLQQAILNGARHDSYSAVLFIDLNRFKELNDEYGHNIGDTLLMKVAERLRQSVREKDTVARLGGDEFIVLLEDFGADKEEANAQVSVILEKINATLHLEYDLDGLPYTGSASIGVELFKDRSADPEQLLKSADMAMYRNKEQLKHFPDKTPVSQKAFAGHSFLPDPFPGIRAE